MNHPVVKDAIVEVLPRSLAQRDERPDYRRSVEFIDEILPPEHQLDAALILIRLRGHPLPDVDCVCNRDPDQRSGHADTDQGPLRSLVEVVGMIVDRRIGRFENRFQPFVEEVQAEEVQAEEVILIKEVIITDIQMSFWAMVMFIMKWSAASVVAIIVLALAFSTFGAILGTLFSLI